MFVNLVNNSQESPFTAALFKLNKFYFDHNIFINFFIRVHTNLRARLLVYVNRYFKKTRAVGDVLECDLNRPYS